jgi:hypothetical protein
MYKLTSLMLLMVICLPAIGQQKKWQQEVDVVIHAKLNDATHSIDGTINLKYTNHSPDTLLFIWLHLWANAFKNDLTAYSDQLLQQNNTAFYFSNPESKGYINRLSFTVDGALSALENHPQHQDIVKLKLPKPLLPAQSCQMQSPFHIQLPANFGDGGYINQTYQVLHWYPQPAVYNAQGWQIAAFLHQGIPASEFGNYQVHLTLPANYKVAASGQWVSESIAKNANALTYTHLVKSNKDAKRNGKHVAVNESYIPSSKDLKTLHFQQNNIQQFAWVADKSWQMVEDSITVVDGQKIELKYFFDPSFDRQQGIALVKKTLLQRTALHGKFPYGMLTTVFASSSQLFPGLASNLVVLAAGNANNIAVAKKLDEQVGLVWFKSATGVNPLQDAWLAEGINNWYVKKHFPAMPTLRSGKKQFWKNAINSRLPQDINANKLSVQIAQQQDQPIAGIASSFSSINYPLAVHEKTSQWLNWMAANYGETKVHTAIQQYLSLGKFTTADAGVFTSALARAGISPLDDVGSKLQRKGHIIDTTVHKQIKLYPLFNLRQNSSKRYLFLSPAAGYNFYDKLMIGALLHNYNLPASAFQFLAAPLYSVAAKKINLLARAEYSWFTSTNGSKLTLALAAASFTSDDYTDSTGKKNYMRFSKLAPAIRYQFGRSNPLSQKIAWLQWKTFLINEQGLLFTRDTVEQKDIITYPWSGRYLNQFQAVLENNRALYPWKAHFLAEQADKFIRLAFTGNYFFNYPKGGGLDVRLFAGKFIYTTARTFLNQALTSPYHLNLTGPKGNEDYTYSNYFYGRSEFEGIATQQIIQRDGFFKVRTDLLSSKIGQTDNWLVAANFVSTLPQQYNPLAVLPVKIPLKLFVDIGTYAEAWGKSSGKPRFVYDAGLQFSLLKNVLNIYVPMLYSGVYRDYFKSLSDQNTFFKRISFSIDVNHLRIRHFLSQVAL